MKYYERIMCKRKALEMSEITFAETIGVDVMTYLKFEAGDAVSDSVFKEVRRGLNTYLNTLDKERRLQISILAQMFSLSYLSTYEKRCTINSIVRDVGKLGVRLYKPMNEEEES